MRIVVNGVPLVRVATGIGRYIAGLYDAVERVKAPGDATFWFDGQSVGPNRPVPPEAPAGRKTGAGLVWRLPSVVGGLARSVLHELRERRFLAQANGFDVYHETAFFPFKRPQGAKIVFTVHDLSLIERPKDHPGERVRFFNRYFHKRLESADRFLTVSAFTKSRMTALLGLDPDRIDVSPLAVDGTVFRPAGEDAVQAMRDRLGVDRYVLFVGAGDPRKNARLIPQAIRDAGLDVPLVWAGWSGWDDSALKERGVIAAGHVADADLAALYTGALALVWPSSYEGFGLPVLEAMACGCPVITSDLASMPEVAGGEAVLLTDPTDVAEMGREIKRVCGDPGLREAMRRGGLKRAADFSWERTARITLDSFREACGVQAA